MRSNKILKITITGLLLSALIVCAYKACKIDTLTHLSENDLEWLGSYHPEDTLFFRNADNQIDTLTVREVSIKNSTFPFMNPFLKLETGSDYIAYAYTFFEIKHYDHTYECDLFVFKDSQLESPSLRWGMGNFESNDKIPTNNSDCMIGNLNNSHYLDNNFAPKDSLNYIQAFEWCKRTGLKWYRLRNGDNFHLCEK